MKAHQVMLFNAIILIVLGVYGYLSIGGESFTPLIAPVIGVILLILSFPVKKDNHTAAHIGVGLTALATIAFFAAGFARGNVMIIVMAVVSLLATIFYISDFTKRKRERESSQD